MKVILVLLILGGIGALALYYGGGYASFDPSEQGRQAKAAIKPGMTWKQVVDAATAPKDYQVFIEQTKRVGNEEVKMVKPGPRNRFKRDVLAGRVDTDSIPNGFIFHYHFSDTVAFQVHFDGAGTVIAVYDSVTTSDLLGMGEE